jgi:uncharacterized protein (TIGR02453 family)
MFTQAYLTFFEDLASNNSSAWFNENRKTYEKEVKKPFEAFVKLLLEDIQQITPQIALTPGEAIFRINRDIRFSADKSPYKTEMSAAIAPQGKKGPTCPGIYLRIGADTVMVGSGAYTLEKQPLNDLRYHLAAHAEEFEEIIQNQDFRATFGEVQGDRIKRLPEDLQEAAQTQPLIYNTSLYVTTEIPATAILQPDFREQIIGLYKMMLPFGLFLGEVLNPQPQNA